MKKILYDNTFRLFLLLFLCLFISFCFGIKNNTNVIWFVLVGTISLAIILTSWKSIHKADFIIAATLTVICMTSNVIMGIFVLPSYLASMLIFQKRKFKIPFYTNQKEHNLRNTLLLIFVVGGALSIINLMISGKQYTPSVKLQWFCDALRAGIFEEVFFRMFFFALCVLIINEQKLTRLQDILCYLIMVLPHVLAHFNSSNFDIISIIILSVLFGLPFAIMQRKQNLLSAMGAHAFVDLIRFITLSS